LELCYPPLHALGRFLPFFMQLDNQQQQRFGVMLWSIWKHGNNKVWNNVVETIQQIVDQAETFLNSWTKNAQEARNRGPLNNLQSETVKWTKLVGGRFKCNVDAFSLHHSIKLVLELVFERLEEAFL